MFTLSSGKVSESVLSLVRCETFAESERLHGLSGKRWVYEIFELLVFSEFYAGL